MKLKKVQSEDLNDLIPLFDGYRQFYRQTSDLKGARVFLKERLAQDDSIIIMAYDDDTPIGFTQLYPLFSSVTMEKMYVLNDLFVADTHRNQGVGQALIKVAKDLCKDNQFKGLALQTEVSNPAQHLYERLDFVKDKDLHFFWTNPKRS